MPLKYKEINRAVEKKCREAKEGWLFEKCREMELLQQKHDAVNAHKRMKQLTGLGRRNQAGILRYANNKIIIGAEELCKRTV